VRAGLLAMVAIRVPRVPLRTGWWQLGLVRSRVHAAVEEDSRHELANRQILDCCSGGAGDDRATTRIPANWCTHKNLDLSLSTSPTLWVSKLPTEHWLRDLAKAWGSDHATARQLADWEANDRSSRKTRMNHSSWRPSGARSTASRAAG